MSPRTAILLAPQQYVPSVQGVRSASSAVLGMLCSSAHLASATGVYPVRKVRSSAAPRRHTVTVQGEFDTIGAPPARICTTFLTGDICPTAEILRLGDKAQTVWLASIDHFVFTTHAEFVCAICGATRLVAQISSRSAIWKKACCSQAGDAKRIVCEQEGCKIQGNR